ncbi:MAG: neutral zinc metallopeptidase [Thermaurantiacus sp.]
MRLDDKRASSNIENRRGERTPAGGGGGGPGLGLFAALAPLILSKFGIVGIAIMAGLFLFLNFGGGLLNPPPPQTPATQQAQLPGGQQAQPSLQTNTDLFVARVLATTEDTWGAIFAAEGQRYPPPTLVFFSGGVRSACGAASSQAGPFYCGADRRVYLDTSFFDELGRRFGAPGDFAAAYVIAHEVGHHVQEVTGIMRQFEALQKRARNRAEANQALVRLELQADCFAGVWAARNRDILDRGDFEDGVRAAAAIGDDTLMKAAGSRVVPDAFTHGTSAQRVRWLTIGFEAGDPAACDTFSLAYERL